MKDFFVIFIITSLVYGAHSYSPSDSFDEELFLKPLPSGHVYAYFQFTTLWETHNSPEICKFLFTFSFTINILFVYF